jgi:hypothetical protein
MLNNGSKILESVAAQDHTQQIQFPQASLSLGKRPAAATDPFLLPDSEGSPH